MDDDYRSQAKRLRRGLVLNLLVGLVLFPAVNLLFWRLGPGSWRRGAHWAPGLGLDVAFLALVLALTLVGERRAVAASRARGGPYPRDRIAALVGSAGISLFLAAAAFMAASDGGWRWGVAFYAFLALFQLRLLLLWRQCERQAAG